MLYGTLDIAKADVPKPKNITFEIVLNRESLWCGTCSDIDWIADWVWLSVFPSAELWCSLWDSSITTICIKFKNELKELNNYLF